MRQPKGVEILDAVTAKALGSATYKRQLLANPTKVLSAEGLTIPKGVKVKIHENKRNTVHLVLPSRTAKTINFDDVNIRTVPHHTGGF